MNPATAAPTIKVLARQNTISKTGGMRQQVRARAGRVDPRQVDSEVKLVRKQDWRPITLAFIAEPAEQPKIVELVCSEFRHRFTMVDCRLKMPIWVHPRQLERVPPAHGLNLVSGL